jgi:hypothetical protein
MWKCKEFEKRWVGEEEVWGFRQMSGKSRPKSGRGRSENGRRGKERKAMRMRNCAPVHPNGGNEGIGSP